MAALAFLCSHNEISLSAVIAMLIFSVHDVSSQCTVVGIDDLWKPQPKPFYEAVLQIPEEY